MWNLKKVDFSGVNFRGTSLYIASFSSVNLRGADFSFAELSNAFLDVEDLQGVTFRGANLHKTYLRWAVLTETDFQQASLVEADLKEADLRECTIGNTVFGDIDLSKVKNLHTVKHRGPSTIGIDTIFRSKGDIPEVFLRGAGVPDIYIEYMSSLTGKAFDYYSCFISYSAKDSELAERLHSDLQDKGVRCWFAPEDMKIGDRIRGAIDQAIRLHDKLLLILSKNSIDSDWVEAEVESALEQEQKRGQTVLFPVRLDDAVMKTDKSWAALIRRTRHIGDFTQWKDHDSYQRWFNRLMRDLKGENKNKP